MPTEHAILAELTRSRRATPVMRVNFTLALTIVALGAAPAVEAGPILESAERIARKAAVEATQTGAPARRSMARTWGGVGLVAGGVIVAFSRQECRLAGSLSSETHAHALPLDSGFRGVDSALVVFHDARNVVVSKAEGRCHLDWTVDASAVIVADGRSYVTGETLTRSISEWRATFPTPEAEATRGTAHAEPYRPVGHLYGGLALAGVGALLATVWSDVPAVRNVAFTPMPGGGSVSRTFGF